MSSFTLLIFWLKIASIYTAYNNSTCPYAGLGERTCKGSGTSDACDCLGYIFYGKKLFFISGAYQGLFYVTDGNFKWSQGVKATFVTDTIYGYALEVPKSNYTDHTFYFIQTSGCPKISILTNCTGGTIPSTDMRFTTLYKVLSLFSSQYYPARCNVVPGDYHPVTSDFFPGLNIDGTGLYLAFSNVVSFQCYTLDGYKECKKPKMIAQKYGLGVYQNNPYTYVQAEHRNDKNKVCQDQSDFVPTGIALIAQNFNFTVLEEDYGFCELSTAIASLAAVAKFPYLFGYEKGCFVAAPYKDAYILGNLLQQDLGYPALRQLWEMC